MKNSKTDVIYYAFVIISIILIIIKAGEVL